MASYTKTTRFRRKLRAKKMGRDRKSLIRTQGTTPKFAVHTPDADANAPLEQLSPAAREAREG